MNEQARAQVVEESLLYLNAADVSLSDYSGAILMNQWGFAEEAKRLRARMGFPINVTADELDRLDGILMCGGGGNSPTFELIRQSSLSRRKADFFRSMGLFRGYPRLCSVEFAKILDTGKVARQELPFAFDPSQGAWQCLTTSARFRGKETYRVKPNGRWERYEDGD